MKPIYLLPTILAVLPLLQAAASPIERTVLTRHQPVEIQVGTKTATTLQFPRPIQGIFGYGLTTGDAPGTYQYTHPSGSRLLTLRNLLPEKDTFVTILLGQEDLFVLHLKPSTTPPVTVDFLETDDLQRRQLATPIDLAEAEDQKIDRSTARLFNLLKLGRNARVFRAALPHLYQDVESKKVEFRSDDDHIETVVTDIHRFPTDDALFLGGTIENKTPEIQYFDPGALEVGVGKRTYPVTLADAAAEIPAGGKIPFHILIQGGLEGERAHLSIKNEFRLLMPEYATCTDDPALTNGPALVLDQPNMEGSGK